VCYRRGWDSWRFRHDEWTRKKNGDGHSGRFGGNTRSQRGSIQSLSVGSYHPATLNYNPVHVTGAPFLRLSTVCPQRPLPRQHAGDEGSWGGADETRTSFWYDLLHCKVRVYTSIKDCFTESLTITKHINTIDLKLMTDRLWRSNPDPSSVEQSYLRC